MRRDIFETEGPSFRDDLISTFKDHLLEEFDKGLDGRICPMHLSCIENGLPYIPTQIDGEGNYYNQLRRLKETNAPLYNFYVKEMNKAMKAKDSAGGTFESKLRALESHTRQYGAAADSILMVDIRQAHNALMKKFFEGTYTWRSLELPPGRLNTLRGKYRDIITNTDTDYSSKLILFTSEDSLRPTSLHSRTKPNSLDRSHPIDLLVSSYTGFITDSVYIPNNNWTVPHMSRIMKNENLSQHFVVEPRDIMKEFQKGMGSRYIESSLLMEIFGIEGEFDSVLALIEDALSKTDDLYKLNGELEYSGAQQDLRNSLSFLREKHDHIRGITRRDKADITPSILGNILDGLPPLAKIAFGGNLSAATLVVENTLNLLDTMWAPTSAQSFVRSAFAPLAAMAPGRERKELALDMANITETLVSAHYSDFEESLTMDRGVIRQGLQRWANVMTAPAHVFLKGITITRGANARAAVSRLLSKSTSRKGLERLVILLEENSVGSGVNKKLPAEDSKLFFRLVREAGIGKLGVGNREILRYLLRSGLLESGKFQILKDMLGYGNPDLSVNTDKRSVYYINEMRREVQRKYASGEFEVDAGAINMADDPTYRDRLFVLQALRQVERIFIEDVLLTPNPLDTMTTPSAWAQIFEVYMRYPTIFAINKVIRQSGRMTPLRFASTLMAASVLDIIYMTILASSYDQGYERLMDKLEEKPYSTSFAYLMRLPAFGRWMSTIYDAVAVMLTDSKFSQRPVLQPASLGAVNKLLQSMKEGGSAIMDKDAAAFIDAVRSHIPGFGDIIMRFIIEKFKADEQRESKPKPGDAERLNRSMLGMLDTEDEDAILNMLSDEYYLSSIGDHNTFKLALQEVGADIPQPTMDQALVDQNRLLPSFMPPQPAFEQAQAMAMPEPPPADSGERTDVVTMLEQQSGEPGGVELADRLDETA
tara:strand:+ start:14 stop:2824 length:2811 start_codon:yes stop_codon:yes gene_type:complete